MEGKDKAENICYSLYLKDILESNGQKRIGSRFFAPNENKKWVERNL